jgi:hypothetical protein
MKNSENIDKIFSEGFNTYERQPRPQAWERLEARLQKTQSKVLPIWWKYASAASVALLLGVGGYWFSSQQKVMTDDVADNKKPVIISKRQLPTIVEKTIPQVVAVEKNIPQKSTIKTTHKVEVIESKQFAQLPQQQFIEVEEKQGTKQIAQTTIPDIKKLAPEPNTIILVLESQKPKVEEETIVLNMVEMKPEVVAQTDSNEGINKKETRLSKIWQQLKRAKNGENVNWSEVGIKPQKMLARADAKIENVLTKGENNEQ